MSGRPTISAPNFPSCRAFWNSGRNRSKVSCIRSRSHILALSNRPRSNRWTGCSGCIDQRPASLAAASAPDGYISLAYPPSGKSSLCNQAPRGKGRHMKSSGPSTSHVFSRRVRLFGRDFIGGCPEVRHFGLPSPPIVAVANEPDRKLTPTQRRASSGDAG